MLLYIIWKKKNSALDGLSERDATIFKDLVNSAIDYFIIYLLSTSVYWLFFSNFKACAVGSLGFKVFNCMCLQYNRKKRGK
jgi:hypothetical protein